MKGLKVADGMCFSTFNTSKGKVLKNIFGDKTDRSYLCSRYGNSRKNKAVHYRKGCFYHKSEGYGGNVYL
jgi:hypothetical protein